MNISIEQLEQLLSEQRYLCKEKFVAEWRKSEILKDIIAIDPKEVIANKIHWVRDEICSADIPNDVKVMKKYQLDKGQQSE